MQVLVNCDDPICCDENLFQRVEGVMNAIEAALHAAEREQKGLSERVEEVLARAAVTVGPVAAGNQNVKENIHCQTAKKPQERWLDLCRLAQLSEIFRNPWPG